MSTFEITVQRRVDNGWPVVAEQRSEGVSIPVRTEGMLRADPEQLKTQLNGQSTPKEYGTLLGQAVFRDGVRDAFVQAVAMSDDRLHVLLFIEAPDLKGLRWERLCAPLDGGWSFLALDQRVPFSLYLPSVIGRRFPPLGRRDLRALIVVANPPGLEQYHLMPFDASAALAGVRAALSPIPCEVLAAAPGASGPPTLDALCECLTGAPYTLLHIVGHGQYTSAGETILYLTTANNQVDPVTATRLLERLRNLNGVHGLPHFAFLSTCESAVPTAEGALGGLAQRLVRDLGMPAVLAMTEKVSVATATALAEKFYLRLRAHGEVDRALAEAVAGLAERSDIHVPVLYSRLGGRPLFTESIDGPLTNADIAYGLSRARDFLTRRAPVMLASFAQDAATLLSPQGADPGQLSPAAQAERQQALTKVGRLCAEALDLSFPALAKGRSRRSMMNAARSAGCTRFGSRTGSSSSDARS